MEYRELLERCRSNPGWLGTRDQREADTRLKYDNWLQDENQEYSRGKKAADSKTEPGPKSRSSHKTKHRKH